METADDVNMKAGMLGDYKHVYKPFRSNSQKIPK
jgi:hypothetical protein